MIAIGARVGPYEVVRPLGEGGFARTFEARHVVLGETACLKVGRRAEDDPLLLREGRILWGLHHPALPTLRDAFRTEDGALALAIRFVEGRTLDAVAPIDAAAAIRLLGRLLKGLRVLHHRGIVHADVKPRNIIVEPDGHGAVLVDFGLAAVRPTASTRPLGRTEVFAAPETEAGGPPLPESDLYGLALSFLHALGGDVVGRVLPAGVPDPLLRFLAALSVRDVARRPRWDRNDPIAWLARIRREIGVPPSSPGGGPPPS